VEAGAGGRGCPLGRPDMSQFVLWKGFWSRGGGGKDEVKRYRGGARGKEGGRAGTHTA
jgi:hypothetical protein